jgi:hypothetical protein
MPYAAATLSHGTRLWRALAPPADDVMHAFTKARIEVHEFLVSTHGSKVQGVVANV